MNSFNTSKVLGFDVLSSPLNGFTFNTKLIVNTLNQYSYVITKQDPAFRKALINSDILLPDGVAIVAASAFLGGQRIRKIAGHDIHVHLLKELEKREGKCFYLGSTDKTLKSIKTRLKTEYPNIHIESYSPPYKEKFSTLESQKMIALINEFQPEVLFVGMTAPKQEKWVEEFRHQLDVKVICSIGAVFDYYAGTVKRASTFWINLGLEWFVRFIKEPKRLWKRYFYYGPVFLYYLIKERLTMSNNQ